MGVASTKAFMNQLVVLAHLAILAARQRGRIDAARQAELLAALRGMPGLVNQALALEDQIIKRTAKLAEARSVLFLGRGPMFPIAMEGALKLKEISYIHAEGYASGELKHGPIALIDEETPVVFVAPHDDLFDKSLSNLQEVAARRGKVLLISDKAGLQDAGETPENGVELPTCHPFVAPILYALPVQMLAYHIAVEKGTDVDQPRNLAKSVTVE